MGVGGLPSFVIYFLVLNMALLYALDIGTAYNITMYAPAILGTGYRGATVTGLLDYGSAIQLEDVSAIHTSVLSVLPGGTPADPTKLVYVKIITAAGNTRVLALNWISAQPTVAATTSLTVVVSNITVSDIPTISAVLKAAGYNSFTIS